MSDTPRTDGCLTEILDAYGYVHQGNCPQRWVNHARELERELNAANSNIIELQSDVNELNELVEYLQDRVKKLKSVGDELINYVGDGTSESNYRLLVDAWEKAKGKI